MGYRKETEDKLNKLKNEINKIKDGELNNEKINKLVDLVQTVGEIVYPAGKLIISNSLNIKLSMGLSKTLSSSIINLIERLSIVEEELGLDIDEE